ncbi:MAG: hypothetical protein CME19_05045 [Gemmatimonadetes bacterium]|nr:hypothetical protein [Gemmatimonadota bacterium]
MSGETHGYRAHPSGFRRSCNWDPSEEFGWRRVRSTPNGVPGPFGPGPAGQPLDDEQQVAFSQRFGELKTTLVNDPSGGGDHVTRIAQPQFAFEHAWAQDDVVMWDNRCVLHRARPFDRSKHKCVMHRTTVIGEGPTAPA